MILIHKCCLRIFGLLYPVQSMVNKKSLITKIYYFNDFNTQMLPSHFWIAVPCTVNGEKEKSHHKKTYNTQMLPLHFWIAVPCTVNGKQEKSHHKNLLLQ